jgi:hypothetical protein
LVSRFIISFQEKLFLEKLKLRETLVRKGYLKNLSDYEQVPGTSVSKA